MNVSETMNEQTQSLSVLHVHDFHHVQVQDIILSLDRLDCRHDDLREMIRENGWDLCSETRLGDLGQSVRVWFREVGLEFIQEAQGFFPCLLDPFHEDSRMKTFPEIQFRLLEEFPGEEDIGCGSVSGDVVCDVGMDG